MRKMTPTEISDEFNGKKAEFRGYCEQSGLGAVLRDLSTMVDDLKTGGVDVSLDLLEMPSELAFKLFADGGKTVPLSGILRIGTHHRLVGIMTQFQEKPCMKLGVSRFDIRHQGTNGNTNSKNSAIESVVRATVYDLRKDENALVTLQKDILHAAARTEVIQEYDVQNAFGHGRKINKPLQKPPFKLGGGS